MRAVDPGVVRIQLNIGMHLSNRIHLALAVGLLGLSACKNASTIPPGYLAETKHKTKADWTKKPSGTDEAAVKNAFLKFTQLMNSSQFEEAMPLYGWRDYERLIAYNSDTSSTDYVGLIKRACGQNGFKCSATVKEIVSIKEPFPGEFYLQVLYRNADGSPLQLCDSASCSTGPLGAWVIRRKDGTLAVMGLAPWQA